MICLTSEMLVADAKSIIAFTFCFTGEIPFPDAKCPEYSISLFKNSHLDIFNFNFPSSGNFSKTNCICCSLLLHFVFSPTVYQHVVHPNTKTSSKYLKNNFNIKCRNTLCADCSLNATHFHLNFPYGQVKAVFLSWVWMYQNVMISWYNIKNGEISRLNMIYFLLFWLELKCLLILLWSFVL